MGSGSPFRPAAEIRRTEKSPCATRQTQICTQEKGQEGLSAFKLHAGFAGADRADDVGWYAVFFELALNALCVKRANDQNEAYSLIKDSFHLGLIDIS